MTLLLLAVAATFVPSATVQTAQADVRAHIVRAAVIRPGHFDAIPNVTVRTAVIRVDGVLQPARLVEFP